MHVTLVLHVPQYVSTFIFVLSTITFFFVYELVYQGLENKKKNYSLITWNNINLNQIRLCFSCQITPYCIRICVSNNVPRAIKHTSLLLKKHRLI